MREVPSRHAGAGRAVSSGTQLSGAVCQTSDRRCRSAPPRDAANSPMLRIPPEFCGERMTCPSAAWDSDHFRLHFYVNITASNSD